MSNPWGPPDMEPVEPDLTLRTESEITKSGRIRGRVVAGVLGVLLLVGGTTFAVTQLGSSGPDSPEEAVSQLLDAASNEDVLGVLAALDPGERDALQQPVQNLFDELTRLEVVDSSFSLDGVKGVDIEFNDVTFRTEPVRDDLARVYFTGGTVTGAFNADELPIGSFVSDTLDRFGADISGASSTDTSQITDDNTFLVARNGSDGWRVSIGYSIAEAARLDAGLPLLASGIAPIGADSPEAAVEGLVQAAAGFDLRGMIARLSPGELGALQDYADLWISDAARQMASAGDDYDVSIDDLSLHSDRSGDRASVFLDSVGVTVTNRDGQHVSASSDGKCFTLEGDLDGFDLTGSPFENGPICAGDLNDVSNGLFGVGGTAELGTDLPTLPSFDTPEIGITTAKVDGKWFVAPVETGLDGMVSMLKVLDRSDLDAIVDFVDQLATSFTGSFTDSSSGFGSSLGGQYVPGAVPPVPTTGLGTTATGIDFDAIVEFVQLYAGDPDLADCMLNQLLSEDDSLLAELGSSYRSGATPSQAVQDAFFAAEANCRSNG